MIEIYRCLSSGMNEIYGRIDHEKIILMNSLFQGEREIGYIKGNEIFSRDWISDKRLGTFDNQYFYIESTGGIKKAIGKVDGGCIYRLDGYHQELIGSYKGNCTGASAALLLFDFNENGVNKAKRSTEEIKKSKTHSFFGEWIVSVVSVIVLFLIAYIALGVSIDSWDKNVLHLADNLKNLHNLSRQEYTGIISLSMLYIGSCIIGIYCIKKNRNMKEGLFEHLGSTFSRLAYLAIPVDIVNFLITQSVMELFIIPFAVCIVILVPALLFGVISWFVSLFN